MWIKFNFSHFPSFQLIFNISFSLYVYLQPTCNMVILLQSSHTSIHGGCSSGLQNLHCKAFFIKSDTSDTHYDWYLFKIWQKKTNQTSVHFGSFRYALNRVCLKCPPRLWTHWRTRWLQLLITQCNISCVMLAIAWWLFASTTTLNTLMSTEASIVNHSIQH